MTTATASPPTTGGSNKKAQVVARPFIVGSDLVDSNIYDNSKVLTTGTQQLPTYELNTDGYTEALYLQVECVGVNLTSTSVVMNEDGPFHVFNTITLSDTNKQPILGPMTGHDLYLLGKYGGFVFVGDSKATPEYSVTSGTSTSAGSFTFVLRVPLEIVRRDAFGAVRNKSDSTTFKLDMTLEATTTIWSTPPATSATVRVRIPQFGWLDSKGKDVRSNPTSPQPPALGSLMYTDVTSWQFTSGSMIQKLPNHTGGIRAIIFQMRDSAGSRSGHEADWPDPFIFEVDSVTQVNRLMTMWRHWLGEEYVLGHGQEVVPGVSGTPETEGMKRDKGVYVLHWLRDFGLQPGAENRFGYLWSTSGTTMRVRGSVGSTGTSHTFSMMTNYVNPPVGTDPKVMTGGR